MSKENILRILEKHKGEPGELLSVLREIQVACGYLPETALRTVAEHSSYPLVDIYSIVTFHDAFRLTPPAEAAEAPEKPVWRDYAASVQCPYCRHELLDPEHRIADRPAVRITVSFGMEHGSFYFASYYLASEAECDFELPAKGEINFFCPHCHSELLTAADCGDCGAPMRPMLAHDGRMTQVCSFSGCRSREPEGIRCDLEQSEPTTVGV
jgi:hypothetical protein